MPAGARGWGTVPLSGGDSDDALIAGLPFNLPVFPLHGDSFELAEGAVRLAGNAAYLNQAFRIGKNIYAVQFHVEVSDPLAREWVSVYEEYIAGGGVTGEFILAALPEKSAELRTLAAHLIQRFLRLGGRRVRAIQQRFGQTTVCGFKNRTTMRRTLTSPRDFLSDMRDNHTRSAA